MNSGLMFGRYYAGAGHGLRGERRRRPCDPGTKREFIYTHRGVNNTEPNFNPYIFQPSIDAIQEF